MAFTHKKPTISWASRTTAWITVLRSADLSKNFARERTLPTQFIDCRVSKTFLINTYLFLKHIIKFSHQISAFHAVHSHSVVAHVASSAYADMERDVMLAILVFQPIFWELNFFFMSTRSFVPKNLHRRWSQELKHFIPFLQSSTANLKSFSSYSGDINDNCRKRVKTMSFYACILRFETFLPFLFSSPTSRV